MLTALLGGTFDPIHYGHIRPAKALAKEVGLTQICLLPNHIPPHKPQPDATTAERLAMLELAIVDLPLFSIDTRELNVEAARPSYTIDTLAQWRKQNGSQKGLAFIMGQDSLLSLPSWKQWQNLLDYCHLLICQRPHYSEKITDPTLAKWIAKHQTKNVADLHASPAGYIYFAHTPLEDISATQIRQNINDPKNVENLLPPPVWRYIHQHGLYNAKKI